MAIIDAELGDRAAIRDVFVAYCTALRVKDLDLMDGLFTADAVIDYSRIGGPCSGLAEVKSWMTTLFTGVRHFQLFVGDSAFGFSPDRRSAAVTTTWHGVFVPEDGPTLQIYGTYEDALSLTESGRWLISRRSDQPMVQLEVSSPS
jgi:hypothetical protein